MRESPALDVIELLHKKKAHVTYHDPYVPTLNLGDEKMHSVPLTDAQLKKQDCVVITTNHSCFDIKYIARHAKLILDTRNATKGLSGKNVVRL
jgi:UDP-N-acetyl-D-glucosamine dehydrogenase